MNAQTYKKNDKDAFFFYWIYLNCTDCKLKNKTRKKKSSGQGSLGKWEITKKCRNLNLLVTNRKCDTKILMCIAIAKYAFQKLSNVWKRMSLVRKNIVLKWYVIANLYMVINTGNLHRRNNVESTMHREYE